MRRIAMLVATIVLVAGGCTKSGGGGGVAGGGGGGGGESPDIGRIRLISALESFSACDQLLDYLRTKGAEQVGPYGFGGGNGGVVMEGDMMATGGPTARQSEATGAKATAGSDDSATAEPAAPVAGEDFSDTNVQEQGVDEPDIVKTDGRRLVTIANGRFTVVDVTGDDPKVLSTSSLGVPGGYLSGELLLAGDKVMVLSPALANGGVAVGAVDEMTRPMPAPMPGRPYFNGSNRMTVTVVDIADPRAPKVTSVVTFDGSMVAARMVDGVARLVLRTNTPTLGFTYPSGNQESIDIATASNKKVVAESKLEDWLPSYSYDEPGRAEAHAEGRVTACDDVSRPVKFSGLGMLTVVSLDAADPRPGPGATVLGAGELVYASTANLYVTSTQWTAPVPALAPDQPQQQQRPQPATTTTEIHKFSIADKVKTKYLASGSISGNLLNQFSLSEYKGDLRVAATTNGTESQVDVLRENGDVLAPVGSVGGLGKGERIFAVRFLGDRGYVVTFRQTDPLYVLDLSDGGAPKVTGELKIPGYSAYLHPIGDHKLLGIGQSATEQGRVQGTQLSLFDVSDPANPTRLANATVDSSQSGAEYDHHAFLYWPKTGLTVVPLQSYSDGTQFVGAVGFSVGDRDVKEVGRITHPDGQPVMRSLVVRDRLLTLSGGGLRSSALDSLAQRSWLALS